MEGSDKYPWLSQASCPSVECCYTKLSYVQPQHCWIWSLGTVFFLCYDFSTTLRLRHPLGSHPDSRTRHWLHTNLCHRGRVWSLSGALKDLRLLYCRMSFQNHASCFTGPHGRLDTVVLNHGLFPLYSRFHTVFQSKVSPWSSLPSSMTPAWKSLPSPCLLRTAYWEWQ